MNGRLAIVSAVLALGGCTGLAVKPMPERLAAEQQQAYDYGWQHLTTVQSEVDRTALLDTILVGKLWHQGVDRLQLRSEKQAGDVLVDEQQQPAACQPGAVRVCGRSCGRISRGPE